LCWTLRGPTPTRNAGWARRGATTLTLAVLLVVALACGCAHTGPAPADAAYGVPIEINTPQGLRAKQTMDMLNSDWPIGPNGIRTLADPKIMDDVGVTMDKIWWDRPFTVTDLEIGAGHATLGACWPRSTSSVNTGGRDVIAGRRMASGVDGSRDGDQVGAAHRRRKIAVLRGPAGVPGAAAAYPISGRRPTRRRSR